MIGLVIGVVRFVLEFAYVIPSCSSNLPDPRPGFLKNVHYLHFGLILFIVVLISCTVISLATDPIDPDYLHRLTFWTRFSDKPRKNIGTIVSDEYKGQVNTAFTDTKENGPRVVFTINEPVDQAEEDSFSKYLYMICGMKNEKRSTEITTEDRTITDEDEALLAATYAKQSPFSSRLCNINAVIVIIIGSFFWGFYS